MSLSASSSAPSSSLGSRVTVALCTFNGARFVGEQLASIARQTRLPDLLVVVDDGSEDDTVAITRGFASAAPFPVHIEVNERRLGTAANFEKAAGLCGDGIVFFSDQDDVWREDKVARVLAAFAQRPGTLLVHTDARLVDESLTHIGALLSEALALRPADLAADSWRQQLRVQLVRNIVTGCTAAVDARLVGWARPFPPGWLHDEWLATIAAMLGGIGWIGEPLVLYRQHAGNQLGVTRYRGLAGLKWLLAGRGGVRGEFVPRLGRLPAWMKTAPVQIDDGAATMVAGALEFARFRAGLDRRRIARLGPVLRQWMRGRYATYGRGLRTVLVDLTETIG